jgi:hypothetical protein
MTGFATEILYFGIGGVSEVDKWTMFDRASSSMRAYNKLKDVKVIPFIGRGHEEFENTIVEEKLFGGGKNILDLTLYNFNNQIEIFTKKIKSGKINNKNPLVVIVNTHGAPRDLNSSELTHTVALNDFLYDENQRPLTNEGKKKIMLEFQMIMKERDL